MSAGVPHDTLTGTIREALTVLVDARGRAGLPPDVADRALEAVAALEAELARVSRELEQRDRDCETAEAEADKLSRERDEYYRFWCAASLREEQAVREHETMRDALRDITAIKPDAIQWVEQNHQRLKKAVGIARAALAGSRAVTPERCEYGCDDPIRGGPCPHRAATPEDA